ncbi:MAG: head-tail connector protein, partial [Bacillota bacterium]
MLTLSEVKQWLRLEESDTAEDALLQSLIAAATEYIRNAAPVGFALEGNPIAGLLARVLVADWHE